MTDATDGFQVPDEPRGILMLLDTLRIRILAFTETLDVTDEEARMLSADFAALTEAVRATEAAEALAREWNTFQSQLLHGSETAVFSPRITVIPPIMSASSAGNVVREARVARNTPANVGVAGRLQRLIERLLAHPNTNDQMLFDLGLLPGATIGFSPGHPQSAESA